MNYAPPPEGVNTPPSDQPEMWLRDAICSALIASRQGEYDGMTTEEHLLYTLREIDEEIEDRAPVFGITDAEADVL